jgi:GTP-binding protein HflX
VDAASEERLDNIEQVEAVLAEIGADEIPCLQVYNKLDLLEQEPRLERDADGKPERVWLSASTGAGCELLLAALTELMAGDIVQHRISLAPDQGRLRAGLYELGAVQEETHDDDGLVQLQVRLSRKDWRRLLAAEQITEDSVLSLA